MLPALLKQLPANYFSYIILINIRFKVKSNIIFTTNVLWPYPGEIPGQARLPAQRAIQLGEGRLLTPLESYASNGARGTSVFQYLQKLGRNGFGPEPPFPDMQEQEYPLTPFLLFYMTGLIVSNIFLLLFYLYFLKYILKPQG